MTTLVFMSILIKCILQWLCFLSPCLRYIYFRCKVKTPQPDTHSSRPGCSNTGTKNHFFFLGAGFTLSEYALQMSYIFAISYRWCRKTYCAQSFDLVQEYIFFIFIYIFLYWNSALNLIWSSSKEHTHTHTRNNVNTRRFLTPYAFRQVHSKECIQMPSTSLNLRRRQPYNLYYKTTKWILRVCVFLPLSLSLWKTSWAKNLMHYGNVRFAFPLWLLIQRVINETVHK